MKGKDVVKVKIEKDNLKKESLEAIKVNLAKNRKPRKIVPTSRANIWPGLQNSSMMSR